MKVFEAAVALVVMFSAPVGAGWLFIRSWRRRHAASLAERVRADYVEGRIDVDEYERRASRLLDKPGA